MEEHFGGLWVNLHPTSIMESMLQIIALYQREKCKHFIFSGQ